MTLTLVTINVNGMRDNKKRDLVFNWLVAKKKITSFVYKKHTIIIIYFHSSQCRLIPYLHQRPIFFKANSIHSSIVAILELIRGVLCLIEVIRSSGEEM
jgi:hypothetical protein